MDWERIRRIILNVFRASIIRLFKKRLQTAKQF